MPRRTQRIPERGEETVVEIASGTPATIEIGSDSYPATISRVSESGRVLWVRRDRTHRGLYVLQPDAPEERYTLCSSGRWQRGTRRLSIGARESYRDPSF